MDKTSSVETCRWSRMTVRLDAPYWLEAEDKPWACLRDHEPRPLEDTDICHGCPRWDPRHLELDDTP